MGHIYISGERNSAGRRALEERTADTCTEKADVYVRWYESFKPAPPKSAIVLNNQTKLSNLGQLQRFTAQNVPTIEYTTALQVAQQWVAEGADVWGRKASHTQGLDVIASPKKVGWAQRDYWVKVWPATEEWRIHICYGMSIARGKKVQVDQPRKKLPAAMRNRRNGWRLHHTFAPPKGMRTLAKAAVAAVGYDFGAVDILWDTATNTGKVLEVNMCPGLDDYTADAYAAAFKLVGDGTWQRP